MILGKSFLLPNISFQPHKITEVLWDSFNWPPGLLPRTLYGSFHQASGCREGNQDLVRWMTCQGESQKQQQSQDLNLDHLLWTWALRQTLIKGALLGDKNIHGLFPCLELTSAPPWIPGLQGISSRA
jgi:hypothetical protein